MVISPSLGRKTGGSSEVNSLKILIYHVLDLSES